MLQLILLVLVKVLSSSGKNWSRATSCWPIVSLKSAEPYKFNGRIVEAEVVLMFKAIDFFRLGRGAGAFIFEIVIKLVSGAVIGTN